MCLVQMEALGEILKRRGTSSHLCELNKQSQIRFQSSRLFWIFLRPEFKRKAKSWNPVQIVLNWISCPRHTDLFMERAIQSSIWIVKEQPSSPPFPIEISNSLSQMAYSRIHKVLVLKSKHCLDIDLNSKYLPISARAFCFAHLFLF